MELKQIRQLLPDYVQGKLNPDQASQVEQALSLSRALQEECKSLRTYFTSIHAMGRVTAPPDFLQKVNKRIEQTSGIKGILRKLVFPIHIKIPVELAGVVVALLVIALAYSPFQEKQIRKAVEKQEAVADRAHLSQVEPQEETIRETGKEQTVRVPPRPKVKKRMAPLPPPAPKKSRAAQLGGGGYKVALASEAKSKPIMDEMEVQTPSSITYRKDRRKLQEKVSDDATPGLGEMATDKKKAQEREKPLTLSLQLAPSVQVHQEKDKQADKGFLRLQLKAEQTAEAPAKPDTQQQKPAMLAELERVIKKYKGTFSMQQQQITATTQEFVYQISVPQKKFKSLRKALSRYGVVSGPQPQKSKQKQLDFQLKVQSP